MFAKFSVILALALVFGSTPLLVSPPEAQAQEGRMSVKKRSTKQRTVRRDDARRTKRHSTKRRHRSDGHSTRRSHRHHRAGVRVHVGTPHSTYHRSYGHYGYGHHDHYYYGHRYHSYPTHTRVVVVEAPEAESAWEMPALDCPLRSDEERAGNEQWCATSRGTRHGPYRRWYEDGSLAAQGEYEYDQQEGVWIEFHPNGALREEGQYDDGKRTGTWVTWGADGKQLVAVDY